MKLVSCYATLSKNFFLLTSDQHQLKRATTRSMKCVDDKTTVTISSQDFTTEYPSKIKRSPPEVFLKNVFRKYPANLQQNTHAEGMGVLTLRHECSPVILLHFTRTLFTKNTCGGLLLRIFRNVFLSLSNIYDQTFLKIWVLTFNP